MRSGHQFSGIVRESSNGERRPVSNAASVSQLVPEDYEDLEIRVLAREEEGYPVEITFSGEEEFPRGYLEAGILPWLPQAEPAAEGDRLFDGLFGDERLKSAWAEARGRSRYRRMRLRIDRSAPELHTLPWELLRDDGSGGAAALAASVDTPFSRYLAGRWRQGQPVLERPIRLLVAIADPEGLDEYGLAPIDVAEERQALADALAVVDDSELEVTFLEPPVTLCGPRSRVAPRLSPITRRRPRRAAGGRAGGAFSRRRRSTGR